MFQVGPEVTSILIYRVQERILVLFVIGLLIQVNFRNNGPLTITDANLVLGRIQAEYFPKIFGPSKNLSLDLEGTKKEFEKLTAKINLETKGNMSVSDEAYGYSISN